MIWLTENEPWVGETEAKYPVLDCPDLFVWADYTKINSETDKGTLKDLFFAQAVSPNTCWTSLHRFCNECYDCDDQKDKDFCDRDKCALFPQYFFNEFRCAKTEDIYYLITTDFSPYLSEEPDWMFIPAVPFNVQIFNTKYLGGMYHVGI